MGLQQQQYTTENRAIGGSPVSNILPRRMKVDPLTEQLKKLKPEEVDALKMMRGIYSNQIALSRSVVLLQPKVVSPSGDLVDAGVLSYD